MSFDTQRDSAHPPRPTLTIVFMCALVFWFGCASCFASCSLLNSDTCVSIAFAAGFGFVVSMCLLVPTKTRTISCFALSLAVGVLLGGAQAHEVHTAADVWHDAENESVVITLLEDSRNRETFESALVEARSERFGTALFMARLPYGSPLFCGERYTTRASFSSIDYEQNRSAWQKGACGTLNIADLKSIEVSYLIDGIVSLRKRALDAIGAQDDAHAMIQAVVCGYRRNIEEADVYAHFQSCGLAHLISVSGAHLVIVTGLVASCLEMVRIPRRLSIALLVSTMATYFVLAGMPVSALRACIMSSLGLVAFFGKRRPSSLNAIGIGLFAIIAHAPSSSISPSLTLSALSTIGIVIFAPLITYWLDKTPLSHLSLVEEPLALTISASLLSQLYASSLFSQVPLVSPLANIACAPLFPLICGSGLISSLIGAVSVGALGWVISIPSLLSDVLIGIVKTIACLPYASIPIDINTVTALVITGFVACALWAWWPKHGKAIAFAGVIAAASIGLALILISDYSDKIVMLDIGQGDSILISSSGSTLLIDTGNKDTQLLTQLARQHIAHIDGVLITHADDDHCGSLDALQKAVVVDRVLVAHDMLNCKDEAAESLRDEASRTAPEVIGLSVGDRFNVGAFIVETIWPSSFTDNGGNADSLCVMVTYDEDRDGDPDIHALMTGDAEKDEVKSMIEQGSIGDIDILKVGHHGSKNSLTEEEALTLKPEIALISCGAHNRYGHPAMETLNTLEHAGSTVFRTDTEGAITCTFSPSGIMVRCEKKA